MIRRRWAGRLAGVLVAAAMVGGCGSSGGAGDASGGGSAVSPGTGVETALPATTSAPSSSPSPSSTSSSPSTSSGGDAGADGDRAPSDLVPAPAVTTSVPSPADPPPTTLPPPPAAASVPPTVPHHPLPAFTSSSGPIGPELAGRMTGVSWHEGCPVPLVDLRLVEVSHVGFDGRHHHGRLVVHADAVVAITEAFRRMYEARFPIERVTLVDDVAGSDDAAMAANLSTAFNCRAVTGGSGWSEHSYGRAVDVNPLQNPYVSSRGTVLPPGGRAYLDRGAAAIGLIVEGGPAVAAFDAVGWQWGGRWRSIKDHQHFSASGR